MTSEGKGSVEPMTNEDILRVCAWVARNVQWDEIDGARLWRGLRDDRGRMARLLTLFLRNTGFDLADGLKVVTAPFNPATFLGPGWRLSVTEHDRQNDDLISVDFADVDFVTCLSGSELAITGEKKLKRLKTLKYTRYGLNVFAGLWNNLQVFRSNSVLEILHYTQSLRSFDFFGDVLISPEGHRCVLCVCRGKSGQWKWICPNLSHNWGKGNPSVVSKIVV